jgi:predicted phage-related endonuclease
VVLGEMIAIETRAVVGLNKLESLFEMLVERQAAVVEVVKDSKAHGFSL